MIVCNNSPNKKIQNLSVEKYILGFPEKATHHLLLLQDRL